VASRVLKSVLVWLVATGLAFWLLYWVVAVGVAMIGAIAVLVVLMSADWDRHSTFEQREAERARRRKVRYERNAGRRARDRARYEAGRAAEARKQARRADSR
jgi:biopolymer transport protein ExbB/TolQ